MTLMMRRLPTRSLRDLADDEGTLTMTVLQMQCGLWRMGFDPGRFDGLWGPVTEAAMQRWFNWYASRQPGPVPDPDITVPGRNRSGNVTTPASWREILDASGRGTCQLEARGAHQPPPVREPTPIVDTPSAPAPVEPQVVVRREGSSAAGWTLGILALLGIGTAVYYATRDEGDPVGPAPFTDDY